MSIFDFFKGNRQPDNFEFSMKTKENTPYFCKNCHECQHGTERDNDCRNKGWCPLYCETATSKIDYLNPMFPNKSKNK